MPSESDLAYRTKASPATARAPRPTTFSLTAAPGKADGEAAAPEPVEEVAAVLVVLTSTLLDTGVVGAGIMLVKFCASL
jgi:hypothetical protein